MLSRVDFWKDSQGAVAVNPAAGAQLLATSAYVEGSVDIDAKI